MGVLDEKKGDAFDAFKSFHAFVTTQKGTKLKCLTTDNRDEFTSVEFKSFCDLHGNNREVKAPYNPVNWGSRKV